MMVPIGRMKTACSRNRCARRSGRRYDRVRRHRWHLSRARLSRAAGCGKARAPVPGRPKCRQPVADGARARTDQAMHSRPHRRVHWPYKLARASMPFSDRPTKMRRTPCGSQSVAASGNVPPVNAFDSVMISGVIPACSHANIVPVRPKPVKISSKISRTLYLSASARRPSKYTHVVKFHSTGTLDQRLDDDPCHRVSALFQQFFERGCGAVVVRQV